MGHVHIYCDFHAPGEHKAHPLRVYVLQHVKPFIDGTCGTPDDPQWTGVMGASLGGLVSLYMGYAVMTFQHSSVNLSRGRCFLISAWLTSNSTCTLDCFEVVDLPC